MRHFSLLLLFIFISLSVSSQHIYKIKTDSLLVTNDSCTAELNLENSTKFVNGFLYNKGKGRTEFRRAMIKLTDSTYLFGDDTLNFRSLLNTIGFSGTNIYNSNGTLTGDRTVTLGTNRLNFSTDGSFRNTFSGSPFSFQIVDNGGWDLGIMRTGNSGGPPNIIFMKTRGTGGNDDVSLLNNDYLMRIAAVGVNVNNLLPGQESLRIFAGAYPTGGVANFSNGAVPPTTEVPTSFNIATSGITGGLLSRFSIYPDGEIILANMGATPGATSTQITSNRYKLQVFGSASVTGSFLMNATQGQLAHSSAQFEMVSTTKGFLPPRWTKTQRNAIVTPAPGLIGYQTDSTENLYLSKSIGWKRILTEDDNVSFTNIYNANGSLISSRFLNLDTSSFSIGKGVNTNFHLFNNGNLWIGNGIPVDNNTDRVQINGNAKIAGQLTAVGTSGFIGGITQSDFVSGFSGGSPATFQVNHAGGNWGLAISRSDNNLNGPHLTFYKTYGNNIASTKGAIPNGTVLGDLVFSGVAADNTSVSNGATVAVYGYGAGNVSYFSNWAAGTIPPTNSIPTSIQFAVTDFDGVRRRALDILPRGQFVISRTGFLNWSTDYSLQVDGNTSLHGVAAIGNNLGTIANPSAQLEVTSTSKGFLPPRMTAAQAEAISSPAEGLMIYATDGNGTVITSKGWWGFNGTTWEKLNN
jgi:hypothetical protein